ncbi:MAG: HD domain-containing protein, partial [Candidatus Eisenbacteria bacterium]
AALEVNGFRVCTKTRPQEALAILEDTRFDAILLDLVMEEMCGEEVLERVLDQDPDAVVILMSGDPHDHARSPGRGAFDFLAKPLNFPVVCRAIERAIAKAQLRGENSQLHQFIHGLANAIEAKDPFTRGHSDRVVEVTGRVAAALGLSEEDRRILRLASILHDVGKIGVPDAILRKPGPLTPEEWALVRQHPQIGNSILQPIPNLDEVRQCVLEHHEKWDGTGYPRGLRGREVSIRGRILILAEVFDALAHHRSYKPAWPRQQVIDFLESQSGRHFDPEITPVFVDLIRRDWESLRGRPAPETTSGAIAG